MFKVGDLVTPDPSKFDAQIWKYRSTTDEPARIVKYIGQVFIVEKVELPYTISVAGEDRWLSAYWRHATPGEIIKIINKYGTDTWGDQG